MQEFETDLADIKVSVFSVQQKFKRALDVCQFDEKLGIDEKIEAILISWNKLLSASQSYHHLLEDALLQLGQLHDAIAELMTWVNEMELVTESVSTDGAIVTTIEEQLSVLQVKVQTLVYLDVCHLIICMTK